MSSSTDHGLAYYLSISPEAALAAVIGTIVLYTVFLALGRVLGQRWLAKLSGTDLVVAMVIGAVIGRTMIGWVPTLPAGLIVVATLVVLEATVGRLIENSRCHRLLSNRPVLLLAHGKAVDTELQRCHITRGELDTALRRAGMGSAQAAAAVVLEPTGELSVIREGGSLDPEMFSGVRSAEKLF